MFKQILSSSFKRKTFLSVTIILLLSLSFSFSSVKTLGELLLEAQTRLNFLYDTTRDGGSRKVDLKLTEDGFLRCRRTFVNGKVEYHSFNISRLTGIGYLGSEQAGNLVLRTLKDDIIVQTYHDRNGDVDSMASSYPIPVREVSAEILNALHANLFEIQQKLKED